MTLSVAESKSLNTTSACVCLAQGYLKQNDFYLLLLLFYIYIYIYIYLTLNVSSIWGTAKTRLPDLVTEF